MITTLITGATDGIGLALAHQLAERGDRLILHGRQPLDQLRDTIFTAETYCQVNLALPGPGQPVLDWLKAHAVARVDRVILNAGTGWIGSPTDMPAQAARDLLSVNLRAPVALTHALLPLLTPRIGQLVFISSVAADLPAPQYAVYSASKAALDGFARDLRIELKGQARVLVIHPGATRTGMHAKVGTPGSTARYPEPGVVARSIIQAMDRGAAEHTVGLGNRAVRWAGRNLGGLIDRWVRP